MSFPTKAQVAWQKIHILLEREMNSNIHLVLTCGKGRGKWNLHLFDPSSSYRFDFLGSRV
jgi:hypothetical protein